MNISFEGETWADAKAFADDIRVDGLDHEHLHIWNKHPDGFVGFIFTRLLRALFR